MGYVYIKKLKVSKKLTMNGLPTPKKLHPKKVGWRWDGGIDNGILGYKSSS
jgi:hypothetical protein